MSITWSKPPTTHNNFITSQSHQEEWYHANSTKHKQTDPVAIAQEGGADEAAIAYIKKSLELDKALR